MSLSTVWGDTFGGLQKIGKALMLPVSVLPVAGILLGVGASIAREADAPWLAEIGRIMSASGDAIFMILPLIFAIGVVLGFTRNDGVAAMAATVGYFVLLAALGVIGLLFIGWTAPAQPLALTGDNDKSVYVEYDTQRDRFVCLDKDGRTIEKQRASEVKGTALTCDGVSVPFVLQAGQGEEGAIALYDAGKGDMVAFPPAQSRAEIKKIFGI